MYKSGKIALHHNYVLFLIFNSFLPTFRRLSCPIRIEIPIVVFPRTSQLSLFVLLMLAGHHWNLHPDTFHPPAPSHPLPRLVVYLGRIDTSILTPGSKYRKMKLVGWGPKCPIPLGVHNSPSIEHWAVWQKLSMRPTNLDHHQLLWICRLCLLSMMWLQLLPASMILH